VSEWWVMAVLGRGAEPVLDRGRAVPLEQRDQPAVLELDPRDLDSIADTGRGLFLIHRLMDRVEFGSEGGANRLLMVMRLMDASA